MQRRAPSSFRPRKGFTLIEVLLALALFSGLMIAMNVFLFSMGELWGRNRERHLFEQHVRAVTRHVDDLLRRADAPAGGSGGAVRAEEVRVPAGGLAARVTFDLAQGDRLLPWPDHALPDVRCVLEAREETGLLLYWQSRWEIDAGEDEPRAWLVSPLVTRLEYDYYRPDFQDWETRTTPRRSAGGDWEAPDRLRLYFSHGDMTADTLVNIAPTLAALPPF